MWGIAAGLGLASAAGQYLANRENRRARDRQEGFQRQMSNTSWQRGVRDMEAAGINPILAYKQGGASTPQGASYTAQNIMQGMTPAYQAASTGKLQAAQAKQYSAQTKLTNKQSALTEQQARKVRTEIETQIPAAIRKLNAETNLAGAGIGLKEAEQTYRLLATKILRMDEKALEKMGLSMAQLQYKPSNQIGSMIIDKMHTMFGSDPTKWQLNFGDFNLLTLAMLLSGSGIQFGMGMPGGWPGQNTKRGKR